jgi:glycosyltransferase involved in cell wall biosynthesis
MVKYDYAKSILVKNGIDKNKIEVISHWIDVEKIRSAKVNKKSDKNFIFTFIGRLAEEKGPDLLLKAFSKIPKNANKLVFVGDGVLKGKLINFCKNNKMENVEFRGYVPHNQIGRYLNESDCIVFPHRYFNYEWALLEAMCVEKPIIATDVEATSEILTDGYNAILCEPNEKSIEGALKRVLECKDLKEIAKNSYTIVKEKHSMKNLEQYERLIRSL